MEPSILTTLFPPRPKRPSSAIRNLRSPDSRRTRALAALFGAHSASSVQVSQLAHGGLQIETHSSVSGWQTYPVRHGGKQVLASSAETAGSASAGTFSGAPCASAT